MTMTMATKEEVRQYLDRQVDVFIHDNNDIGERVFAIAVVEDPEFWLDAKNTEKDAVAFCNQHGLRILAFDTDSL